MPFWELFDERTVFPATNPYPLLLSHFSHYEVRFIEQGSDLPGAKIASLEEAQKSSRPTSFKLIFPSDSLPRQLKISPELLGNALKEGATYSVVAATVAKSNVSSGGGMTRCHDARNSGLAYFL